MGIRLSPPMYGQVIAIGADALDFSPGSAGGQARGVRLPPGPMREDCTRTLQPEGTLT